MAIDVPLRTHANAHASDRVPGVQQVCELRVRPLVRDFNDRHCVMIQVDIRAQQSLSGWMGTLVDYVRSGEPDLTNRQMALLLLVYLDEGPHTVRGIAQALRVSKPVVTRALNRLGALGYLRRERDQRDKRNIYVVRTPEGAAFLEEFGQFVVGDHAGDNGERSTHRLRAEGQVGQA